MKHESDGKNTENKDLEEGEICVSDEEEKTDVDDENAKWINRLSGSLRPATYKRASSENLGADESQAYESKAKRTHYFDYDQMQNEDDWSANAKPSKGRNVRQNCIWSTMSPLKKKDSPTTSEGAPNSSSFSRERSSPDSGAVKVDKNVKLGALCRIRVKKKSHGKKRKKRPRVKDSPVPEDRPLCKYFQDGHCAKGDDCPFYHPPMKKRKLCKFYSSGNCRRGKDCGFMHEEFPCKFFHTGAVCYSDEKCRFSHKPLTEETKMLLNEFLNRGLDSDDDDDTDEDDVSYRQSKPRPHVVKNTSILGSPPRHIRESRQTKEWQEEMKRLSSSSERFSSRFRIKIPPVRKISPPSPPSKPSRLNFYTDTLLRSSNSTDECFSLSETFPSPNKLSPLVKLESSSRAKSPEQDSEISGSPKSRPSSRKSGSSADRSSEKPDVLVKSPIDQPSASTSKAHSLDYTANNVPNYTSCQPAKFLDSVEHSQEKTSINVDSVAPNKPEPIKTKIKTESSGALYYNSEEDDDDFYSSEDDGDSTEEYDDVDFLTSTVEMSSIKPCHESPDNMPNGSLLVKSAKVKSVNEKSKANTDEETDAYWEDIMCDPPLLSPVTDNQSFSSVEAVPSSSSSPLEDSWLHNPRGSSDSPLDLRVKCHDSRKAIDFSTDLRLKSKQQKHPTGEIFSSPPLLIVSQTENQPYSREGTPLQKPKSAVVSEGLQDLGSVLYKSSDTTTYPHNSVSSLCSTNGEPLLPGHLTQNAAISNPTLKSSSIMQPGILPGKSHYSPNCETANCLTNGNYSHERTTPTSESSNPETLKASGQRHVDSHLCATSVTGGLHEKRAYSPLLNVTPTRSHPRVPARSSHLPGLLGDKQWEKLHFPHLFFRKGSMAERKNPLQKNQK